MKCFSNNLQGDLFILKQKTHQQLDLELSQLYEEEKEVEEVEEVEAEGEEDIIEMIEICNHRASYKMIHPHLPQPVKTQIVLTKGGLPMNSVCS